MKFKNIGIVADRSEAAQNCKQVLTDRYNFVQLNDRTGEIPKGENIDAVIAVGGDGFMLETLHNHMHDDLPVYGLNQGTIGFLLNNYSEKHLLERLDNAADSKINPIKMTCEKADGSVEDALAINEISLLRTSGQAAKLKISVDGTTHMQEMICDGILVCTPAGSSAYNYSNGGMILPIKSNLIAMTPICPFRPRRWRGALLPNRVFIEIEVLKPERRPVKAVADNYEVEDVSKVRIELDRAKEIHLLFDRGHSLEERIMREQFEVC